MPLIAKVGRKHWKPRLLILTMYCVLLLGAVIMVYPILLMLNMAMGSQVDYDEYGVIPSFLHEDRMLLKKHIAIKYFDIERLRQSYGRLQTLNVGHEDGEIAFKKNDQDSFKDLELSLPMRLPADEEEGFLDEVRDWLLHTKKTELWKLDKHRTELEELFDEKEAEALRKKIAELTAEAVPLCTLDDKAKRLPANVDRLRKIDDEIKALSTKADRLHKMADTISGLSAEADRLGDIYDEQLRQVEALRGTSLNIATDRPEPLPWAAGRYLTSYNEELPIAPPYGALEEIPAGVEQSLRDWAEYLTLPSVPVDDRLTCFLGSMWNSSADDPGRVAIAYQEFLREEYNDDILALNTAHKTEWRRFGTVQPPVERPLERGWMPGTGAKQADWTRFRQEHLAIADDTTLVSVDSLFHQHLRVHERHRSSVDRINYAWKTHHRLLSDIVAQPTVTATDPPHFRADWSRFVRTKLPFRYLTLRKTATFDPDTAYQSYMQTHGDSTQSYRLPTAMNALSNRQLRNLTDFINDRPSEKRFREFLSQQFGRLDAYRDTHFAQPESFEQLRLPDDALLAQPMLEDWEECFQDKIFRAQLKTAYRDAVEKIFEKTITLYNKARREGTDPLNSFADLQIPSRLEGAARRSELNDGYAFLTSAPASEIYQAFLKNKYKTIDACNAAHGTRLPLFTDIRVPITQELWPDELLAFAKSIATLKDKYTVPTEAFEITSPDNLYRAWLRTKYTTLDQLNEAYGQDVEGYKPVASFDAIHPPVFLADLKHVLGNKTDLRVEMATRNFSLVFKYLFVHGDAVINTLLLCVAMILTQLIVNPLAAYALSRYNLPGTYKILLFCLATMAFPAEVSMIPSFLMLKKIGLLNTYAALILPGAANGFAIFLLKGFFDTLPKELYEAGAIDGAGDLYMFWNIALPLSKPIFAFNALNTFMATYGSFMWAFVLCNNPKSWTVMVWLYQMQFWAKPHVVMAALAIASIPTLLVFIFCQRIIIRGIVIPQMD